MCKVENLIFWLVMNISIVGFAVILHMRIELGHEDMPLTLLAVPIASMLLAISALTIYPVFYEDNHLKVILNGYK